MLNAATLERAALDSGFTAAALARPRALPPAFLDDWLARGCAADMGWMAERRRERLDPEALLPGCRTVLALACCFAHRDQRPEAPIARYAQGRDYHATVRDRLRGLRRRVLAIVPTARTYAAVDAGPLPEKVWAAEAGLGWIGHNAMLVTRAHGSSVVLAAMLLDLEMDRYGEPSPDHCGSCRACLDACPTGAILPGKVIDSRRCLSYQTIENRGLYGEAERRAATGLAFGCDRCQDVCPWNRRQHACDDARFAPRELAGLDLVALAALDRDRFRALTQGTAVARAQFDGLRRNALIALGAARDPRVREVAQLAEEPSPAVQDAARWALARASADDEADRFIARRHASAPDREAPRGDSGRSGFGRC